MRISRIYRPTVDPLEPRVVPSGLTPSIGAPEDVGVGAAGTVPQEGNGYYTLADWEALHGDYATESAANHPSVVFLGDSITYGWTLPDPAAHGSSVFATDFSPLGAQSYGIPADETGNLLWRVENGELAGTPQVAIVLIGINDVIHGASAQAVTSGIVDDVSAIHKVSPGTQVIVLGLLPTDDAGKDQEVSVIDAALSSQVWGPSAHYLDVNGPLTGPGGVAAPGVLFDGLHPSELGYQLIANQLIAPLSRLLGSRTAATSPAVSTPQASNSGQPATRSAAPVEAEAVEVAPVYIMPIDPSTGVVAPSTPPRSAPKAPTTLDSNFQ